MTINEPKLTLEKMGDGEWRFKEAEYRAYVHVEFQKVLEAHLGKPKFGPALRTFILSHSDHMEAFTYYALLKLDQRKATDALVFAHTAVAIGRQAFTSEFVSANGQLPTGWTENRPFLRALYTLMLAQTFAGGLDNEAIATGEECLHLDPEDRSGARLKLVEYYLRAQRPRRALALFEREIYRDAFWADGYLHAFALFELNGPDGARDIMRRYLGYYPQVARFILDPNAEPPKNESVIGGEISGSEYEGWVKANTWGWMWRHSAKALAFLKAEAESWIKNDWKRTSTPPSGS